MIDSFWQEEVKKFHQWFGLEFVAGGGVPVGESTAAEKMKELEKRCKDCQKCKLAQGRQKVVVGSGKVPADLMIIGEAPGAEEDKQGLPFVGRAGQLLTKMLAAIQIRREEVYITNVVKCRPPRNRDPQPDEIVACRPYLLEQIQIVSPKVILALGGYAGRTLLERPKASLKSMRGTLWEYQGIPLLVTYHPAALLRNPQYKRPAWEDLKQLKKILESPSPPSPSPSEDLKLF